MSTKNLPGKRSGEAASNTRTMPRPITHPAYGLFWHKGMSPLRFLRNLPKDIHTYVRRLIHYLRTGIPEVLTWEYASGMRDLTIGALRAYKETHYGYPDQVPTLLSLQRRAAGSTDELEYISALEDSNAAEAEWNKIIDRLIELLYWMDENNEIYEQWADEVWEPVVWRKVDGTLTPQFTSDSQDKLMAIYNQIDSAQNNAKHEYFVIVEEIYYNLWD